LKHTWASTSEEKRLLHLAYLEQPTFSSLMLTLQLTRELPDEWSRESSTARELFAIKFGLESLATIPNKAITIYTDNQAAVTICRKGSMSLKLHELAEQIWEIEDIRKLTLEVKWIPREYNNEADAASREIDYDDWRINDKMFRTITNRWGYPDIDMFANDRNAKCSTFFSDTICPRTAEIDAFEQHNAWNNRFLWLVPRVSLLLKTLKCASHFRSFGILGCPLWEAQPFFPLLKPISNQWAGFVKDGVLLPTGTKLFENPSITGAFESVFSRSPFVVLLIDFRVNPLENKPLNF
uniref:RNase H domain-containing protein n=1 Tax=Heligmosomoides polygyrus TaxID=6339 RepID=A0A183G7B3_HELPZ